VIAAESHLRQRGGRTRPLNRTLEATKLRREPVWAFSEQNEGDAPVDLAAWCRVKGGGRDALNGVWETALKSAVFCHLPSDTQLPSDNV
jgi:hypothetical protein